MLVTFGLGDFAAHNQLRSNSRHPLPPLIDALAAWVRG